MGQTESERLAPMHEVFGRTNRPFPRVWLSLQTPRAAVPAAEAGLVEAAVASGAPLDVGNAPSYWAERLRGAENPLLVFGGRDLEHARDADHASDLLAAHLIETLSSLQRTALDFYFLRVRRAWEEHQTNGAMAALESARADGLVRHFGLYAEGPALAVLGVWRFHDAFEALMVPDNPCETEARETLAPLARERRVGLVTCRPLNWGRGLPVTDLPGVAPGLAPALVQRGPDPVLVGVRSAEEVRQNTTPATAPIGFEAVVADLRARYEDPATWAGLADDPRPWVREAARRCAPVAV